MSLEISPVVIIIAVLIVTVVAALIERVVHADQYRLMRYCDEAALSDGDGIDPSMVSMVPTEVEF